MPLVQITTNVFETLSKEQRSTLVKEVTSAVVSIFSKPSSVTCVSLADATVGFGGDTEIPTAFVVMSAIGGLSNENNDKFVKEVTAIFAKHLNVASDRLFINFTDFSGQNWGFRNSILG
eukprot:TRINITY_DN15313_c0_g1_i1.p1 TRINITY_DN15313_c0_g1~~TRINITY_DN15313_c0_g1_i1.p1  ORF type:complete len:119 (+),score=21.92 TRINITY_DN15313_c0_g1_i1:20-376(+)